MSRKWTTADIPDQSGRVAVVTGANTGLGYQTAAALADKGTQVVLAVRNLDKGENAVTQIRAKSPDADVALQRLDLTSLDAIREAAGDPAAKGGQYYGPDGIGETRGYPKVVQSSKQSRDEAQQQRLWEVSEELTGVTYPV